MQKHNESMRRFIIQCLTVLLNKQRLCGREIFLLRKRDVHLESLKLICRETDIDMDIATEDDSMFDNINYTVRNIFHETWSKPLSHDFCAIDDGIGPDSYPVAVNINGVKIAEILDNLEKTLPIDTIFFSKGKKAFYYKGKKYKIQKSNSSTNGILKLLQNPNQRLLYRDFTSGERYSDSFKQYPDTEDSIRGINQRLRARLSLKDDLLLHYGKNQPVEKRFTVEINPKYRSYIKIID